MEVALFYYTLFSLAPLLLLVIAVAGLVFNADVARGEVLAQLGGLIGTEGRLQLRDSGTARVDRHRADRVRHQHCDAYRKRIESPLTARLFENYRGPRSDE